MTRKDFLAKLGVGAAFALTVPCLHSCSKADDPGIEPPANLNLTLDLDDPRNGNLRDEGGFVVRDNAVVVARTLDGGYAAASLVCSHQQNLAMTYDETSGEWLCLVHGARFDESTGASLNAVPPENEMPPPLTIYRTSLSADGRTLTVTS